MIDFSGIYRCEHYRKGELIGEYTIKNAVVDEGINNILEVYFHAGPQITSWYLGLIASASAGDLVATDTMASHAAWTESQDYDEISRPAWPSDAAANKEITNSTYVVFTMNAAVTISGLFCVSDDVKGGTSGILWSTGLFENGDIAVQPSDVLRAVFTVRGAAS